MIERGERFFRRMHRNEPHRSHPVVMFAVEVRDHRVVGATEGGPEIVVGRGYVVETGRGVEDRVVDAQLVHARAAQRGKDRGGTIKRVPRGGPKELRPANALIEALLRAGAGPLARLGTLVPRQNVVAQFGPEHRRNIVQNDLAVFQDVPVGVDRRMTLPRTNIGRTQFTAHVIYLAPLAPPVHPRP